jgi:hypothetical protein
MTNDKPFTVLTYCSLSVPSNHTVFPFDFSLCAIFSHFGARPKLPILYGCETWSLTLGEERRLRELENRVLRTIFGPKTDEVTGEWRKLHNEAQLCYQ